MQLAITLLEVMNVHAKEVFQAMVQSALTIMSAKPILVMTMPLVLTPLVPMCVNVSQDGRAMANHARILMNAPPVTFVSTESAGIPTAAIDALATKVGPGGKGLG